MTRLDNRPEAHGAFPPHDPNAPILEGIDYIGVALMVIMALGPLTAYAFGFG